MFFVFFEIKQDDWVLQIYRPQTNTHINAHTQELIEYKTEIHWLQRASSPKLKLMMSPNLNVKATFQLSSEGGGVI